MLVPLLLVVGAGSASAGKTSTAPPPADVAAFVEAERAFARDAAAHGIQPAFIAHLAPQSIVFRPAPVDAQSWLAAHPGSPEARLSWTPAYVEVSTGGDLGWTTGPWDYRRAAGEDPVAFGHYATVWRRQPDGTLRAVIDAGHDQPAAGGDPLAWSRAGDAGQEPRAGAASRRGPAERALLAAERTFEVAVGRDGYARALAHHAERDLRIGRDGRAPILGLARAGEALGAQWAQASLAWSEPAGGAAEAGDVGYTYGTVTPPDGPRQAFLRAWRNPDGKRWRLVLDITTDAPVPAPAPPAQP